MNKKGISKEELFAELSFFSNADTNFKKVFSSMCTIPHPIAVAAQNQFSHTNIGDPGLFSGTKEMENEIIQMSASLLNHSNPECAFGHLTSGGTESNIEAVLHMKNRFLNMADFESFDSSHVSDSTDSSFGSDLNSKLNLILPKTAHFSFEKIANLLNIELRKAETDSDFKVIPKSVNSLIDENTIGLIGVAGNTEFGVCDPIEKLSEIAVLNNLPLHVDAAFGGFVYPFLESPIRFAFDFSGVSSVSIDPHKMGLSVIPSGILIFKDKSVIDSSLNKIQVKTPYLTSKYQSTLTGTRSGASVAATYAVMKHLGREGYQKNVAYCMDLTNHFQNELIKIGLKPHISPQINIVTVRVCKRSEHSAGIVSGEDYEKTERIRKELLEKYGWNVSATKTIPALRFVLMPHVTKEEISALISDLKKILDFEEEK